MTDAAPVNLETSALLTPAALGAIRAAGPDGYAALVVHGGGTAEGRRLLADLRPEQLVAKPVARADAGSALLAGLWLWHDWLDDSHTLSQGIGSPTGSFWHAHMQSAENA